MKTRNGPAGENGAALGNHIPEETHHKDTRQGRPAPYCRPGCALICTADPWLAYALDDGHRRPPTPWRVAYILHGLGSALPPLPADRYRDALGTVEDTFGIAAVRDGLRLAAQITPPHGSPVDRSRIAALADRYDREVSRAA